MPPTGTSGTASVRSRSRGTRRTPTRRSTARHARRRPERERDRHRRRRLDPRRSSARADHRDAWCWTCRRSPSRPPAQLGEPSGVTWIHHDLLTWLPPAGGMPGTTVPCCTSSSTTTTARSTQRSCTARWSPGAFVIGTFAEDGPTHCSALPVRRYAAGDLEEPWNWSEYASDVEIVDQRRTVHRTPGSADQPFNWIAGRLALEVDRRRRRACPTSRAGPSPCPGRSGTRTPRGRAGGSRR